MAGLCEGFVNFLGLLIQLVGEIEDGRRFAARAGDKPGKLSGEFAVGAVVGGEQQAFKIGHKTLGVQLLPLKPQAFFLAQRQPLE